MIRYIPPLTFTGALVQESYTWTGQQAGVITPSELIEYNQRVSVCTSHNVYFLFWLLKEESIMSVGLY